MHTNCIWLKRHWRIPAFLSLYNLLLAEKDFTQVNHYCNHISSWKLQQKYYWKNKEYQWSSDENWAVHSNIKYVLKRQRKMQLLIITYHKGNSGPGCHQWQCSHFFHLRLQLQILPVKMKEKVFTTLISTEFPRWQACRYKTHSLFSFSWSSYKVWQLNGIFITQCVGVPYHSYTWFALDLLLITHQKKHV